MSSCVRSGMQLAVVVSLVAVACAVGADWPRWGGRAEINFASGETGLPSTFSRNASFSTDVNADAGTPSNILWTATLGTQTYSTPAVADGRVYLGTNDGRLEDPRLSKTNGGLILCLDEVTGQRLWQLPVPMLKTRNKLFNFDDMDLGICSSPLVDGNRVYLVSSRGEEACMHMANSVFIASTLIRANERTRTWPSRRWRSP